MGTLNAQNRSLWVATTADEAAATGIADRTRFDVVVVGAGISGLTTAYLLARDGASVAVVEADRVCSGVTAYTTAKVTALQQTAVSDIEKKHGRDRAAAYAQANRDAVELIGRLVETHGIDCDFQRAPACTYTSEESGVEQIQAEHEACAAAGLATRLDPSTELPYDVKAAVWLDDQAHFHPRRYCLGLAGEVVAAGGVIREGVRALDVDERDDGCVVETSAGELRAGHVVVTTLLPFLDSGGFFARAHPTRSYAMAVRLDGELPRGMYINAESPTRSIRPTADGWVVLGGEGHKTGHDDDTRQRYAALEAWAVEHFAVRETGYRWSAQDYHSVDEAPYVGRLTAGHSRVWVGTAFRKWGMTNGTVAATLISDAIRGRDNPYAEAFDSTRIAPGASVKSLVKENIDVGKRFVADRVKSWQARPVSELAPGEGDIVEVAGEAVAAFREENGTLHAVSATCRHLGCRVAFNTAERTWDCPCHGSRYDVDGRLITGPAVEDLPPVPTETTVPPSAGGAEQ